MSGLSVGHRRPRGNERLRVLRTPVTLSLPDPLIATLEALAQLGDHERNSVMRTMLRDGVESALSRLSSESRAWVAEKVAEIVAIPRTRNKGGSNVRRAANVPRREKGAPLTVAAVGEALAEMQRRDGAQDWAGATHARTTVASAPPSPVDDRGTP